MRKTRSLLLGMTLGVGMTACAVATEDATDPASGEEVSSTPTQEHASKTTGSDDAKRLDPVLGKLTSKVASQSLLAKLKSHERQIVLVALEKTLAPEVHEKSRTHDFTALGEEVMAQVDRSVVLKQTFSHIPLLAVEVSSREALAQVLRHEGVVRVYENERHYAPSLDTDSATLVSHAAAVSAGGDATGIVIASIDTGVDYTVDAAVFGACATGPGAADCRVAANVEVGAGADAVLDNGTDGSLTYQDHGTYVAAILADAAPNSKIRSYDVFDGAAASSVDIAAAINAAITANVDVINLGVASDTTQSASDCGSAAGVSASADAVAVETALAANIVVVAPSGNDHLTNKIAAPACVKGVVAVGAVYDFPTAQGLTTFSSTNKWYSATNCSDTAPVKDTVPCFSNSAANVTVLAPGFRVSVLGDDGTNFSGTSAAAPFASAAAAMLVKKFPAESPELISYRMSFTGTTVTDTRNSVKKPRLDMQSALAPTCIAKVTLDDSLDASGTLKFSSAGKPPTKPSFVTATVLASCNWTLDTAVALPSWLIIDNDGTSPFTGTASGTANVASTFVIDTDPTQGATTAQTYTITLKPQSGSVSYVGTTVPVSFAADTTKPTVNSGSVVIAPDAVTGVGADATSLAQPSVKLNVSDDSGTAKYCLSATNTGCTTGTPTFYPMPSVPYTVPAGDPSIPALATDGAKYIYAAFKDYAGNVSNVVSDSIKLDTTAPATGTLKATAGVGTVTLTGTGFTDGSGAGVATVKIVRGATAPADCSGTAIATIVPGNTAGTLSGGGFTYDDTSVTNGQPYAYRACATDNVGLSSTGSTSSVVTPTGDITPPAVSSVVLSDTTTGSTTASASKYIKVAITANDPTNQGNNPVSNNSVLGACVSTASLSSCASGDSTFHAWGANVHDVDTTLNITSFDLSGGATITDGTKSVYVRVIDDQGNMSAQITKTIILDTAAPTGGYPYAVGGDTQATITILKPTDTSGIASYALLRRTDTTWTDATDCTDAFASPAVTATGTTLVATQTTTAAITDTGLTNSTYAAMTVYRYKLCAIDNAGHIGQVGSTTWAVARAETTVPTINSVTFAPGAGSASSPAPYTATSWTNAASGTVTIKATDAGGLQDLCVLVNNTRSQCMWVSASEWASNPTTTTDGTTTFTLPTTNGQKSFYVWARDYSGNISSAKTFTVKIDTLPPSNSATAGATFSATSTTSTNVTFYWTPINDIGSGTQSYKAFYALGSTAPTTTCSDAATANLPTATFNSTTKQWTTALNNVTRSTKAAARYISFRICARDNLGNWNTGVTRTNIKVP